MDPVLGRLTDEGTLITSGTGITLSRMTTGTNEVVELGKFNNERVPIVLVERAFLEILLYERGFKLKFSSFLVAQGIIRKANGSKQENFTSCF
jgi:hypothetical protein